MYCKNCKNLFETEYDLCPFCSSDDFTSPQATDFCLLAECRATTARMIKGIFDNEGIPSELVPSGSCPGTASGRGLENYTIFVTFEHFERAYELIYVKRK